MEKLKLNVFGLSYARRGTYALILVEEGGNGRIPIIIGSAESQAIAMQLENFFPTRPLIHDLFKSFADAFAVSLVEVNIYRFEKGLFYSELILENKNNRIRIESKVSDAVAIALRFKSPIYTTREILNKAGFILKTQEETGETSIETSQNENRENEGYNPFETYTTAQLNKLLEDAVQVEDYEKATLLKKEITRRNK